MHPRPGFLRTIVAARRAHQAELGESAMSPLRIWQSMCTRSTARDSSRVNRLKSSARRPVSRAPRYAALGTRGLRERAAAGRTTEVVLAVDDASECHSLGLLHVEIIDGVAEQ
jgi:hypothetical protein